MEAAGRTSGNDAASPRGDGRLRVGDVIAEKYRIEAELGAGGMGAVYAATHLLTHKRVAIKWMLPRFGTNADAVTRFLREAQAAGRIDHPNVINVYDVGRQDGTPFLVMEILSGAPFSSAIACAPLPSATVVELMMPALRGIAAAHAVRVVHRDLKPDNVFLCADASGRVTSAKVLDFGISKLSSAENEARAITQTGAIMGTPQYMAPEQIRGMKDIDERSDVYAIGVMLYQALTGRLPFDEETFTALAVAIAVGTLRPPRDIVAEIEPGLDDVVMRALQRARADRWPDVATLARALEPFGAGAKFGDVGGPMRVHYSVGRAAGLAHTVQAVASSSSDVVVLPDVLGTPEEGKSVTREMTPSDAPTRMPEPPRSVEVSTTDLAFLPKKAPRWQLAAAAAALILVVVIIAAVTLGGERPAAAPSDTARASSTGTIPAAPPEAAEAEPQPPTIAHVSAPTEAEAPLPPSSPASSGPASSTPPPSTPPPATAPASTAVPRVTHARSGARIAHEHPLDAPATTTTDPDARRARGVRTGGVSVDDF